MERREATLVLKEICKCILDPSALSCISLNSMENQEGSEEEAYELQIAANLEPVILRRISTVVKRHNLEMRKSPNCLVICPPKVEPMEIVA